MKRIAVALVAVLALAGCSSHHDSATTGCASLVGQRVHGAPSCGSGASFSNGCYVHGHQHGMFSWLQDAGKTYYGRPGGVWHVAAGRLTSSAIAPRLGC